MSNISTEPLFPMSPSPAVRATTDERLQSTATSFRGSRRRQTVEGSSLHAPSSGRTGNTSTINDGNRSAATEIMSSLSSLLYQSSPHPIQSPPFSLRGSSASFASAAAANSTNSAKAKTPSMTDTTRRPRRRNTEKDDSRGIDAVDWKREYMVLREAMRKQKVRLEALERDKERLQRRVMELEEQRQHSTATTGSRIRKDCAVPPSRDEWTRTSDDAAAILLPGNAREDEPPTTTTPRGSAATENSFSPGARFVAELTQVLDLDRGHHAVLSSIMDRTLLDRR